LFNKIYFKICLNDQGDKTMSGYIKYEVHVYASGNKFWYLNGKQHREDGPAIDCDDGYKCWYIKGHLHREDGPAVECANGQKVWYLDGQQYREDTYKAEMARRNNTCNGKVVTIEGKQYELTEIK
jgi:hypothetical protein